MIQVRKMGVAAGTFSVALGIGFVMQNGDALAARMGQVDAIPQGDLPSLPELPVETSAVMPALPDVMPALEATVADMAQPEAPAIPDMPEIAQAELTFGEAVDPTADDAFDGALVPASAPATGAALAQPEPMAMVESCQTVFTATAAQAATVDLTLSAPCMPSAEVTIHHHGMLFTTYTDDSGSLTVTAPALAETAVFIADVAGEDGAVAVVTVPDVAAYDRAVLQWQGSAGLELHARQFGADYNSEGHIWYSAAGAAALTVEGTTGFLLQLGETGGDEAYRVQVYTYPSGNSSRTGDVVLTVEAAVTEGNCGRTLAAQTLQLTPGDQPIARDLDMTLPECDAVGDVLVLNNMLQDLTLASR